MKKRKMMHRLFSGLLVSALVCGSFPLAVQAEPLDVAVQKTAGSIESNERKELDFSTDWLYIEEDDLGAISPDYEEDGAEKVSLPHARDTYDLFAPDMEKVETVNWYRRHFTLSEEDKNDRVLVEFNGGGQVNRVYVNGAFVGQAVGTFTHFAFDITDYVTFGDYDNVISVQVDSRYHRDELPPGNSIDFYYFGGLHGTATMTLVDEIHADSVFYYNEDVVNGCEEAVVHGWIDVKNHYEGDKEVEVISTVYDIEGKKVSFEQQEQKADGGEITKVELEHIIDEPNLWSPDSPYLYTVETELLVDGVSLDQTETTIGIRTLTATKMTEKEGYFILNGERIEVFGGNWHMQAPYLGNSKTAKLNAKDVETLRNDLGINFIRTSHYQTDPSFLEACDWLGLMVEEEPLGWNDTPGWDQFVYSLDAMVKRDRNHASIVLWSIVPNERPLNYPSVEEGKACQSLVKGLDPSRLTIQEDMHSCTPIADVYGWHDYANPSTGSISNNPNASSWFVTEWNTNLGKHFVIPGDSEVRKTNQIVRDGEKMGMLMNDKRVMGSLKWDMFGYYTPNSAYEKGKNVELWRSSGVYGIWRNPLHKTWIAYLMEAQSPNEDTEPMIKIASEWKSDSSKTIRVITNLDEVELYYDNGSGALELVKRMTAANEYANTLVNGMFRFDNTGLVWNEDSRLVAKGYEKGNSEAVAEDIVFASTYDCESEGASLVLHNTIGELEADGADVAWILAELQDKNGQREFYGDELVTAEILRGPGELVYAGDYATMVDGISGFYLRTEQDQTGTTKIRAEVDLGINYDDSDTSLITYKGNGWQEVSGRADSYENTIHESSTAGNSIEITFTGKQIVLYSESSNTYGNAKVTIDGKDAGTLNCSNIEKYGTFGNQASYRSEILEDGEHTLIITVGGGKVNLDRVKVFDGVFDISGTVEVTTFEDTSDRVPCHPEYTDADMPEAGCTETLELLLNDGKAVNQNLYTKASICLLEDAVQFGETVLEAENSLPSVVNEAAKELQKAISGLVEKNVSEIGHKQMVMEGQTGGVAYVSSKTGVWINGTDNSYANKTRQAGDYYSITFDGVQVELYSTLDASHGIAAVSIDGGEEVEVDQYKAQEDRGEYLFYTSELLEAGQHTVVVRVTGKTSGNPNNACVSFKRAVIYDNMDELLIAKESLAEVMESAKGIIRTSYTTASMDNMDQALAEAETIIRDKDASWGSVETATENLLKALDELKEGTPDSSVDAKVLVDALEELNAVSTEDVEEHVIGRFDALVRNMIKDSWNLIAGTWPSLKVSETLPKGTTETRLQILAEKAMELAAYMEEAVKPWENPFKDVAEGKYYYEPVAWGSQNGIVNGLKADEFGPKAECTRGQIVTFIWRAMGKPEVKEAENIFTDLEEGKYYYDAVLWAVEEGIVNGLTATTFGPEETCTRAQMATFLYRHAGEPAPADACPFPDVAAGKWYTKAATWASEQGIVTGYSNGSFGPDDKVLREQTVTMLYRYFYK